MAARTIQVNPYITDQITALQALVQSHKEAEDITIVLSHPNYQQLTEEQRFFFLLTKIYGTSGGWRETNVDFEWSRLLQMRVHVNFSGWHQPQIASIVNIAMNHGVIHLHEPIASDSAKLILGCGHGNPVDGFSHAHPDSDTIDGTLCASPTWVGEIGEPRNMNYWVSTLGGRYRSIMDEGPIGKYTPQTWEMLAGLLQPGGILIIPAWIDQNQIPETCPLSYHDLKFKDHEADYRICTKALPDETYSSFINSDDIPMGVRESLPANQVINIDQEGSIDF